MALTCDGAKPNRRFFSDHFHITCAANGVVYKTPNIYRPGNYIYFISDVPHLLKTTRNAWANSKQDGTRELWVCSKLVNNNYYVLILTVQINGYDIRWHHLVTL